MKRIFSTISFMIMLLILLPNLANAETALLTGKLLQEDVPYYAEENLEKPVGSLKGMNSLYQFSIHSTSRMGERTNRRKELCYFCFYDSVS